VDYVPDTSVIIDGRFTSFIESQEECRVILAEAMISEVEHQANEGRAIGFAALDELKKLRELEREGRIYIEVFGRRPQEWQIKRGKAGEIDEIIRSVALENDAILVTGDRIQKDIAIIKGIKVEYLEPLRKEPKNIEEFFDDITTSVHLKANLNPVVKKGHPGDVHYEKLSYIVSRDELQDIATHIVLRGRNEDDSFIEMDSHGATVVQLKNIRIVITRPPFSDDVEITAVRPIAKLAIDQYNLRPELLARLGDQASGILIAGAPGAGKSTFVQALAEYLSSRGNIVKTMEKPRDLQVSKDITQYTGLEGSMEKTGDILLLVREDYTVFDEMRVTSDFKVYSDLRLAGVGMVGVVHATRAIDAIQRFIGRIELGLIPQIVDTVIFIEKGFVGKVLTTTYSVKVPSGMREEDLARPVIEVKDFQTGVTVYEIYTFGEQIVVVPVAKEQKKSSLHKFAEEKILQDMKKMLGTRKVAVKMIGEGRVQIQVAEENLPRVIGKKGAVVNELEKKYGLHIDVEPIEENGQSERQKADIEIKNRIIYLTVGEANRDVKFYVDNILILQAKSSSKGIVRIKIASDTGAAIYNYIKKGKEIEYSFTGEE
jgi:ATPase